ncbi:lipoyl(octanoyl) transferase LipB [Desulfobotulus mexicanus]|uniref:Octanoyltransferase n=1 Tax=Desulfobotulus mexicanus TaxID=2586642 RepID=A0A5Q4VGR3_9BACT|nr:lipoyl(octanoyl) transferase LipB [Desulfobotulus mexicanus]TYT75557.1 lipoyl(octanoyl) transferase LipB [Desulfobotulus mexicanus]
MKQVQQEIPAFAEACEQEFSVKDLGLISWESAFCLQQQVLEEKRASIKAASGIKYTRKLKPHSAPSFDSPSQDPEGDKRHLYFRNWPKSEDVLFLLEHHPVFTLGKRGGESFFRLSSEEIRARGAAIVRTDRGGLVTYHGPGQLVVYPVFDIQKKGFGVRGWVDFLERVMVDCAARMGVMAHGREDARGLWVENRKLGSIGVAVKGGVSLHGLALNVSMDLEPFSWISPCGLDVSMGSLQEELGVPVSMDDVKREMVMAFTRGLEDHRMKNL